MLHAAIFRQNGFCLRFEDVVEELKHSLGSDRLRDAGGVSQVREENCDLGLLRFH